MFRWYVVNTYSGHENKVKQNLEHRVVSLNQQRAVRQVVVPTEAVSEMKDNQKVTVEKRTMPGYVLVNMDLNEDSWSLVTGPLGRLFSPARNGEEGPHHHQAPGRRRPGQPSAAGRPRAGPARHQHHGVLQGVQRPDPAGLGDRDPGGDHRLRGPLVYVCN